MDGIDKTKCPYTNDPCKDWHCNKCEVQQREIEWMEELDRELSEYVKEECDAE